MNNRSNDFLINFLDGLEGKGQAYLNYYFAKERMKEEFVRRSELEKIKNEIIADVMSRISIRLNDEALTQLRDMLNNLGQ